MNFEQKIM